MYLAKSARPPLTVQPQEARSRTKASFPVRCLLVSVTFLARPPRLPLPFLPMSRVSRLSAG